MINRLTALMLDEVDIYLQSIVVCEQQSSSFLHMQLVNDYTASKDNLYPKLYPKLETPLIISIISILSISILKCTSFSQVCECSRSCPLTEDIRVFPYPRKQLDCLVFIHISTLLFLRVFNIHCSVSWMPTFVDGNALPSPQTTLHHVARLTQQVHIMRRRY